MPMPLNYNFFYKNALNQWKNFTSASHEINCLLHYRKILKGLKIIKNIKNNNYYYLTFKIRLILLY